VKSDIFPKGENAMKQSTYFVHVMSLLATSLLLIIVAGCIISEYDEYQIILNADGKSGTIYITNYNLQSDHTDPVEQQDDFDNLINDWKSDQYLLDRIKDDLYVKDRKLFIERGKLVWKEKAIFADIYKSAGKAIINDTMSIGFKKEEAIIKTNGILIQTKDSTIVQWSLKTTKKFVLKIQRNNFRVKSDFAKKFKRLNIKR
jgi:hypothetical protein